jgi:hypothetical protein
MRSPPPVITYTSPGHWRAIHADWRDATFTTYAIADIRLIRLGAAVTPHHDLWPYGRVEQPEFTAIFPDLATALSALRRDGSRLWDAFLGVSRETLTPETPA